MTAADVVSVRLVTRDDVNLILDESLSEERFHALYTVARRVVQAAYPTDVDALTGRPAEIVAGVLTGVIARIVSNPKGARQLNAGGAGLTFGGSDAEIARAFTLNATEREALAEAADVPGTRSGAFTIRPGRPTS